ncbi:SMC family ATPase [Enteractinococcus fodinae]|uniref:Nuclease SbcCD subunit C n=1 Tax=Enteractinococcus fodinae TaxID=684663 RepID=A0ABU2AZQ4_9MICC|nr:SMC family ATPase [Enteractinococcus fodinae]MDR7346830.1 exonuclease SbcC [Enteractinococcus fodinae]
MRIHELTFQAIGPYAAQQHLCFESLDAAGLFLLDGPTGAGKSTILDTITFALYGKADDDRKNTELHSTLAEPGVPPTIQLDVSFGTRRFVIDRTLQHYAPRRGAKDPSDVVARQASMSLVEIVEGERRQLTTRVDEAQQILRGVIGLSREQFTSVVLLPQGEFARFLKASSNDREAILRQLFNTHRFDEIGDYLNARAKKLRGTVETDQERRHTLRAGLIETAETYGAAEPDDELHTDDPELDLLDDEALVDHVDGIMTQLEAAALRRVEHFTKAREAARKTVQRLEQQQEQVREAGEYRRRQTALEDQAAAVEAAQLQLAHHQRAKPVLDAQQHCDAAKSQLTAALEQLQDQCDTAQQDELIVEWAAGQDLFRAAEDTTQQLSDGWKSVEASAIRALEQLAQLEKTQASVTASKKQLSQWLTTRDELAEKIAKLGEQYDLACENLAADKTRAEELSGVEQHLTTATQRLEEAKTQQAAAKRAEAAQVETERLKKAWETAKQDADNALEKFQDLTRRRIEAAAGFLADKLQDGQPCEVCGSTSHPEPASTHGLEDISNEAVQQAEQRAIEARRAANDAEETYQAQHATLQSLKSEAGGLSLDDATDQVTETKQAVTTAKAQVKELEDVRTRIKTHETQIEQLRDEKSVAEQQRTEIVTQITTLTAELEDAEQHLTQALGTYDDVAAFRAAVEPARRLVGQLVEQTGAVAAAVATHDTARQRVTDALAASTTDEHSAFADIAEAREHVMASELCAEHEDLIRRWTTEKDRLEEKAGQAAVKAGLKLLDDGVEAPTQDTIDGAHEAQRAAEAQLSDANREHGSIQATHAQCRTQQASLIEVSRRSAELLAEYEELVGLSDVVAGRGENAVSMPLRSFVLAGWLEQVALNASERLTGMTGGRYELQHAVGQGGRGHAGLNLEVIDHLNDTIRTPSTLSGGETFMASLALALGLADAVQAQAGGVAMDTLFIDEGFGSLDADTLEEVMGVLATLQDDGRLIGLVSHVESMKQQIPHRIQVTKGQAGSTVDILGPGLA